jgi:hypothetical protein
MPKKRNPAPAELNDEYWTTQDGRRIAVGEMNVEHLRNVLRMILRNRQREAAKLINTPVKLGGSCGKRTPYDLC